MPSQDPVAERLRAMSDAGLERSARTLSEDPVLRSLIAREQNERRGGARAAGGRGITAEVRAGARLFHSIGHPMRIQILCAFGQEPLSPSDLRDRLAGRPSLGLLAYHVRTMRDDALLVLVATRPAGGSLKSFYALTDDGRWARDVIDMTVGLRGATGAGSDDAASGMAYARAAATARRLAALTRVQAEQWQAEAREQREEARALRAEGRQARRRSDELRRPISPHPRTEAR